MYYDDSNTRAKNRKKIVDITKELFFEKGIGKTTVMDIVKNAKLERKTFYNYFMDKEEVADYIYVCTMDESFIYDRTMSKYDGFTTGYEKVENLLNSMLDIFSEYHKDFFYFVRHDFYYQKKLNDSQYGFRFNDLFMDHLHTFIEEGIIDGSLDISPFTVDYLIQTVLNSLVSLCVNKVMESYKHTQLQEIEFETVYSLLELLLKSIKKAN